MSGRSAEVQPRGTVESRRRVAEGESSRSAVSAGFADPASLLLLALVFAAGVILALGFIHPLAYRLPSLREALETIVTLLALAAAALLASEFLQTRRLRKFLLLIGLLLLALVEFVGSALPAALQVRDATGFTAVAPVGQLLVAGIVLAAAITPPERLFPEFRRPLISALGFSALSYGVAEVTGLLLSHQLLAGGASESGLQRALHHPLGFAVLAATTSLYALAAVEFGRRVRIERDAYLSFLAAGIFLLAVVRLYYLALPWISSQSVSPREALRVCGLLLIFAAVVRRGLEIRATQHRAAAVAERRRVAQDLHDGLAQDLALIAAHGVQLGRELGDEHPVVVAARRALDLSRSTIRELSDNSRISLEDALRAASHELSHRFGIRIAVDVRDGTEIAPETRTHLVRIVREAIANAARHGEARTVVVSLRRLEDGFLLRVRDDGCGIGRSESKSSSGGFGLRDMSERAAAIDGSLSIRPLRGRGTELEVIFP